LIGLSETCKNNWKLKSLKILTHMLKQNPYFPCALSGFNSKLKPIQLSYYCFGEKDMAAKKACGMIKQTKLTYFFKKQL